MSNRGRSPGAAVVVLTGGGTGGHVYPALAVARSAGDNLAPRAIEFVFIGRSAGVERQLVERAGLPFYAVEAAQVRGLNPLGMARGVLTSAAGLVQCVRLLGSLRPRAVLATGGFVCVPVVVAARLLGIPTLVYLPDLEPGWAVRFLARVATRIAVSFDEVVSHFDPRRTVVTGYPVRPEFYGRDRQRARQTFRIDGTDPVLMVYGASQGARSLNEAIGRDLERLLAVCWIVHVSGSRDFAASSTRRDGLRAEIGHRYVLSEYLHEEMADAFAAADLVVSRAGASSLGELPAFGAPAVLVPYPHAGAHQRLNADFLVRHGAAITLDDAAVGNGRLGDLVLALLADRPRLRAMSEASRRLARPDAARRLLDQVLSLQ